MMLWAEASLAEVSEAITTTIKDRRMDRDRIMLLLREVTLGEMLGRPDRQTRYTLVESQKSRLQRDFV